MSEASRPDPLQKFIGAAIMAVGGLITALSGTCTLVVIGGTLMSIVRQPGDLGMLLTGVVSGAIVVAIFGGIPIVAGVFLVRVGWRTYRPRPRIPPEKLAVFTGGEPPP